MAKKPVKGRGKSYETDDKRPSKGASVIYWILLALVVFGLGGYGVTNFGGRVTSIGSVGSVDISTKDYGRTLQQQLRALRARTGQGLTMQQAREMGLDRQVLQQLVTTAALDNEDEATGLSVGDARLRAKITSMPAFMGPDGKFDRTTYAAVLKQNGLSEHEFEQKIRAEMARELLQDAVVSGFSLPPVYIDTLVNYIGERRGFDILKLTPDDLKTPVPAPTDAQIEAWYKAHPKAYTSPEAKRISYVALLPDMLAPKVKIDDKALHDAYQSNIANYRKPARRMVDRLVYPTEAAAKAAKARLDSGQATFEDLVKARGLQLSDIDMGDVGASDLSKDAAKAVFAAKDHSVVGPVQSSLGPALFRITGVIPAQDTTFAEARPDLLTELQQHKAANMISGQMEHLNDMLASGATIENMAKETDMQEGHIDFTDKTQSGIAAYEGFRDAANKLTTDDYPTLIQLDDGGVVAMRLDKVIKPALIPLAKVRDRVIADWTRDATDKAVMARADAIVKAVNGGAELASFGPLEAQEPVERSGYIEGAPKDLLDGVFAMKKGETKAFRGDEDAWVIRLTDILPPDQKDPDLKKARGQLVAQADQSVANDAFILFATALEDKAGIHINQAAVNAVNAQFH